jgi:hypothetical protein
VKADSKTIVDILVLVPEYRERSTLIDSAIELVRSKWTDKFKYTLVEFPEEDPRFGEIEESSSGQSYISQSSFFKGIFEPFSSDRGFNAKFDCIDDSKSFETRIGKIQNWLQDEAEDYWYEMDRPDFKFDTSKTLGVYLNPNPHLELINSGQLSRYKNVFFIQLSSLLNVQNELHIHLAKFLWTAPFRFLLEDNQTEIRDHLNMHPAMVLRDTNPKRLRRLIDQWSSDTSKIAHDMRYFISIYLRGIESLEKDLTALQKVTYRNIDFIPFFNKQKAQLEIKELSIYIPLNLKQRVLYQFLVTNPEGISQSTIVNHRQQFLQLLLSDLNTNEGFNQKDASKIVDEFQFEEELRITVSKINKSFEPFIFIPKIKKWTVIRVGETYRIMQSREPKLAQSIFD